MASEIQLPMGILEIYKLIPHRYPFLLIDRIVEFVDRQIIVSEKNVTINEPFFQGHFPGRPIMPGVLILEAMAQTGACFSKLCSGGAPPDSLTVFSGLDEVRFRRLVMPGDILRFEMSFVKVKLGLWTMKGQAKVGEDVAAEAVLLAKHI